jgi:hypothetical protein
MGYYDRRFRDEWEAAVAEAYADELGADEVVPATGLAELEATAVQVAAVARRVSALANAPVTAGLVRDCDTVEQVAVRVRALTLADGCTKKS